MFEDNNEWLEADYRTALGHIEAGRLADAELLLRAVLAMDPNYGPAWFSLGYALIRCGRCGEAVDCFANATVLQPQLAMTWFNHGSALLELGRHEEAIASFENAASLDPDSDQVQMALAQTYGETGRTEEAFAALAKSALLAPTSPRPAHMQGYIHRRLMQLEDAAACFRRAIELAPDLADAWADLGTVLQSLHQTEEAKAAYATAIELVPGQRLASLNLSRLLLTRGEFAESRRVLEELMATHDSLPEALWLAAEHARLDSRWGDAIALYHRALEARPDNVETLIGLGMALQSAARYAEAFDSFRRASELAPRNPLIWAHIGSLLVVDGQLDQSVVAYGNVVMLAPTEARWITEMASVEIELGRPENALAHLVQAAALAPADPAPAGNVLACLPFQPELGGEELVRQMEKWSATIVGRSAAPPPQIPERDAERKLRVGYLLPNLAHHPVQPFVEALLTAHDSAVLDLLLYTTTPSAAAVPPTLATVSSSWRFLLGASAQAIADQMRRDAIDILVDVSGHRLDNRLDVLALRGAPIQIAWPIGTGLSTGLAAVDVAIGDERLTPPALDGLFTETVLRPFAAYACYRGPVDAPEPSLRPNGEDLAFGYVGRMARINDRIIAAWAEILRAVPSSRLRLDHSSLRRYGPQQMLRARFTALGIAAERIEADFSRPVWSAWERIDIALDPFPASAGASVIEGLWMGVPSVSLAGPLPSGRFGAAILPHVGLADWVVDTPDAYVARAIAAAQDRPVLAELRRSLRARLAASPLCDARGFAAALEATYLRLWREQRPTK